MQLNSIKIGLLGLGTVGGGTVNVLRRNAKLISSRTGYMVEVTAASVRSLEQDRICDVEGITLSEDPYAVIESDDVDIICELIGGTDLAKDLVEAAIDVGKPVVTANKALIATYGNQLVARAQGRGVPLRFEASVAGGISVVKDISEGLAGNDIELIAGIINGTGNFILTEMRDKGSAFADVLRQAQELGYAEADPTFDVEGIDAAQKLSILASLAWNIPIDGESVYAEGITDIELKDMAYANELGYQIKHLGIARKEGSQVELRVHPTLVPKRHLLANVDGVMNAVVVKGNAVGETLHYGAGAGSEPTASAVVADIVDLVRNWGNESSQNINAIGYMADTQKSLQIKPRDDFESAFYLRVKVNDVVGVMSKLTQIFAAHEISLEAITQKEPAVDASQVSIVLITDVTKESKVDDVIAEIESLDDFHRTVKIRLEHFG